jgi:hypothetical protein
VITARPLAFRIAIRCAVAVDDGLTGVAGKRLWGALLLVAALACGSPPRESGEPIPTRPPEKADQGPSADLRRVMTEQRIPVIRADGTPAGPLLTPLQASAAFGGLVMFIGGVGAFWLWRRADVKVPVDEPHRVVRNSAGPPR